MKGWKSVCDAAKIDRLARISKLSARTIVCVYKMPLPKVNAITMLPTAVWVNAITMLPTAVWQKTGSPK